jgi:hypothetical protein
MENVVSARSVVVLEGDPGASCCRSNNNRYKILTPNPTAGLLHSGMPSVLEPIEDDILFWLFEFLSVRMLVLKASELTPPEFNRQASDQLVCRFLKAHDIVHCAVTHESQRAPHEVEKQAKDWMEMIRPMVAAPNQRMKGSSSTWTRLQCSFPCQRGQHWRLKVAGPSMLGVPVDQQALQVRLAVAVTASGHILPLLLCLRGSQMAEFNATSVDYLIGSHYACQERAWMDEWYVTNVLLPYVENVPEGVVPILACLDSYRCHMHGKCM